MQIQNQDENRQNEQQKSRLAAKVLSLARDSIMINLRFLDTAVIIH